MLCRPHEVDGWDHVFQAADGQGRSLASVKYSVTPGEGQRASLQKVEAGRKSVHRGDRTRVQKGLGC